MPRTPAWPAIEARLSSELGGSVRCSGTLGRRRRARATWAARAAGLGDLVVKARHGDRADEKTNWCADNLPRLAARGYPVPEILWHGFVDGGWHIVVQRRLPGRPLRSLEPPLLDAVLALVELQADADVESTERDFAAYQAYVLFDGWDHVWRDAEAASSAAAALCARLRRWLDPVWGHRLPAVDFANNDLNLSNLLSDGQTITGVVDWDEFGLNSRAYDLTALAFDCERMGDAATAAKLFERAEAIAGEAGLRCLSSYQVISHIAALVRRGELIALDAAVATAERALDRLGAQ
jgi:aminoglycoside phosphotransferase (APT) family kinase protein